MLEDILHKYFGFNGEIGSEEWNRAYDALVSLVYALDRMDVLDGEEIVTALDEIESSPGY